MQNKEELSKVIGPNAELKAMLIAAIPRNTDDPRFEEKLIVVNEVMLEICLLMQEKYRKDIDDLTASRDKYRSLYESEFARHSIVLGILSEYFPPGADIRECIKLLTTERDEARRENETWRADVKLAAGELMGPVPEPGTDMARVCIANRLMRNERDEARTERNSERERATNFEQDLWNCRAARDAYSAQVDAYRKWEQRISKG